MSNITIAAKRLCGEIVLPPDKSISHRAIIIASLAQGKSEIKNLSLCADCLHTLKAFQKMGVAIEKSKTAFSIQGKGLSGLRRPAKGRLYLGNSGTSMRLILGVLAGQPFSLTLSGDASLSRRPMQRVIEPLSLMGARIKAKANSQFAPLTIHGRPLKPISYRTPITSAQVKSAILLAGLYARGKTSVTEPAQSRDHSERMLAKFGAHIEQRGLSVSVQGRAGLSARDIQIPADISAASFFLVAAAICPSSQVLIKSVGLNPTRIAYLKILQKMGARIGWQYQTKQMAQSRYNDEAVGEVWADYSKLKAITISSKQIPALVDELPILMVAATQAQGQTKICGASELRVKETDRIKAMVTNLAKMGADINNIQDDIIIRGPVKLKANTVDSFGDHRIAMSMAIAGLAAQGPTTIKNAQCVEISFPNFFKSLKRLQS